MTAAGIVIGAVTVAIVAGVGRITVVGLRVRTSFALGWRVFLRFEVGAVAGITTRALHGSCGEPEFGCRRPRTDSKVPTWHPFIPSLQALPPLVPTPPCPNP